MFLAAVYWRGSMNVASMRLKKTHAAAVAHLKNNYKDDFVANCYRIYEMSETEPPKLRKAKE